MAAAGAAAEVMAAGELKPLLMLSKHKPVSCAIGMTKDKQGVVLLDRRMKPRKLLAELKSKARAAGVELDIASLRFGRASIDSASDSSAVHFTINKPAPGALRMKLIEKLKPAGFQRCEIAVDEALETETADEDDPGGAGHAQARAPQTRGPGPSAAPETPAPVGAAPDAADPEPTATTDDPDGAAGPSVAAAPDARSLTGRLTGLVKRAAAAIGTDPAGADAIRTAARDAKAALAAGELAGAGQAADTLERLLGGSGGTSAQSPGTARADGPTVAGPAPVGGPAAAPRHPPGSPVFAKAKAVWTGVRTKLQTEIHAALKQIVAYHGEDDDVVKQIRDKIEPILTQLDDSLSAKLDALAKGADGADNSKLTADAGATIQRYRAYVAGEVMVAKLDANPFHPMAVGKTLDAALGTLAKVVQSPSAPQARVQAA